MNHQKFHNWWLIKMSHQGRQKGTRYVLSHWLIKYDSLYESSIMKFLVIHNNDVFYCITGWYKFYHIKYSKENLFMWSPMQKTFILLHIRAMNIRSKFVEMSDHVSKLIFYYIENFILPHYESLTDFDPKKCGKI